MSQVFELQPKKWPQQARSKATFDALVEACTLVLPKLGYAGTTTNHIAEASGVGIASLYEYFPGKDAIIAQAAERMSTAIINQLAEIALSLQGLDKEEMMQAWLQGVYDYLNKDKDIIRVLTLEVPYYEQISQEQGFAQQLIRFSELIEAGAAGFLPKRQSKASMYLIVNLVVSSLTQLVINPPEELSAEEVIEELSTKLNAWVFA